ncbi:MAG: hypothetical protein IJI27_08145 [Oscillospiraceae bacterium]|nr:hypothetical protein [Oscillospiraceae bacterium]
MRELIGDVTVYYPGKLADRRDEVITFAAEMIIEHKVTSEKMVKVFENKRHELMAVVARKEQK